MIRQPNCRPETRSRLCAMAAFLAFIAFAPGLFAQHYPDYTPDPAPAAAPAAAAAVSPPATVSSPETLSSNRFLFVVDISTSMRKHGRDILDVVQTILSSGASGQLHVGDTIGVWTFNDDVYTGGMPLQTWSADDGPEIIQRITEFLSQQKLAKKSRLDRAMVPVEKVVKLSDIITVFIISSGAGPIRGTPFDNDINDQYELCLHDMGNQPMPIVTVLQGKRGKLFRYTVNAMPWPVVIPALPTPLKLPPEALPQAAAPAAAPNPADQSVAANAAPAPAPAPVQPPPVMPVMPPPQVPPSAYAVRPETPVTTAIAPVAQPQAPPAVVMGAPPPASPPPAVPAPVAVAVVPMPAPENPAPTAPAAPPPEVEVRPPTSSQLPLVPPRQPPLVPKTLPATGTMAENAAPAAPVPQSPTPASAPVPAPAAAPVSAAPAQPPPQTLIAQATALIKSFTGTHRSLLLIGGVSLLVVASGLILLMARRSRPSGRVSLISQTMDDRRP
jgi:hypothetical protein